MKKINSFFISLLFISVAQAQHTIGERYGGGIVFYVYDNGAHGLIAATTDQGSEIPWYNGTHLLCNAVRNDGIGTGRINTDSIIAKQGAGNYAAAICAKYLGGGFGDWYLPSKYELNLMFENENLLAPLPSTKSSGFLDGFYWSSSECGLVTAGSINAWTQNFGNGVQYEANKNNPIRVRAVRAF